MVYIPDIVNYKPFYIQTSVDDSAIDTTTWGLVAKSNPYPVLPIPKDPYKNDWLDSNGDDEYTEQMYYKSFTFDVSFYIKTIGENSHSELIEQIDSFFQKIKQGEFMIYDAYTGIGRKKVRYAGFNEEEFKRMLISGSDWSRAIFSIIFKVNDPITRIVLEDGKLIEA